jgi:hypothetical protein
MPSVSIIVDVAGESAGVAGQSRTFPYVKIAAADVLVSLSLSDTTGITSFFWEIASKPDGSTAVLNDASSDTPTFYATSAVPGTYLIRCTVNGNQSFGTVGLAFTTPLKALRKLAAGETREFDSALGWAAAINEMIEGVETTAATLNTTLDLAYDGASFGDGRSITADSGAVLITAPNGSDTNVLELVQNDETNTKSALKIDNNAILSGMDYSGVTPGGTSLLLTSTEGLYQTIWSELPLLFVSASPSGPSSLYIGNICPDGANLQIEANADSSDASLDVYCNGNSDSSPSPSLLNIGLTNNGSANAQMSIISTSTDGDASLVIYASNDDGSGSSYLRLGYILTESLRFADGNLRYSTWTQTDSFGVYFEFSSAIAEWNTFKTNFGEVSLIAALNALYALASA